MKIFTVEAGSPEEDLGCWEELEDEDESPDIRDLIHGETLFLGFRREERRA